MLAEKVGLAPQTVTNITGSLIGRGIVLEEPLPLKGKGRNALALRLNYAGFFILSVRITWEEILVILNDLDGGVLTEERLPLGRGTQALDVLKTTMEGMISRGEGRAIAAIVISVAGIVNDRDAIVVEAYSLCWRQLNLRKELAGLGIPVFVLNDVNILAYYENAVARGSTDFLLIKVEDGVGSALVINRTLVKGANKVSGELGHLTAAKSDTTVQCFCGRKNCITQFITSTALERRLGKPYAKIVEEARQGVPGTLAVIEDIGILLAPKILDLIVLLDLDRVVLLGRVIEDFEDIIYPRIRSEIQSNISFWVRFDKLEVKKYDNFPRICNSFLMEHYFSEQDDFYFLWDPVI
ncbi:MAG: ROK family protein [Treponema sp.]|nr:ROK family protein [Treponema sp.]